MKCAWCEHPHTADMDGHYAYCPIELAREERNAYWREQIQAARLEAARRVRDWYEAGGWGDGRAASDDAGLLRIIGDAPAGLADVARGEK